MAIKTPPPAARIPHRLTAIGQEKTSEIRVARTTVAPAMYIRPRLRFRFTARLISSPEPYPVANGMMILANQ